MKYVIALEETTGYHLPVLFPEEITHSSIGLGLIRKERLTIKSAGFVYRDIQTGRWRVDMSRGSESLKTRPAPEDETLLNLYLNEGLAGLDLSNASADWGTEKNGVW